VKQQNPIGDCATRVATWRSKSQIVQLQRRQGLAIVKDEVVQFDKGIVGFWLRVSRLGECISVRRDALMTPVFAMNFPYISKRTCARQIKMLAKTNEWSAIRPTNPIQSDRITLPPRGQRG
jgi:hypothetical protein